MLTDAQINESIDFGTEEIFGSLPAAIIIPAKYSRLTVDLNRSADQSDEKGVIARVDYHGRQIFFPERIPNQTEMKSRIEMYYHPFHRKLTEAVESKKIRALFDCHSLDGIGPANAPDAGQKRKDIILSNGGDEYGCPVNGGTVFCPPEKMRSIKSAFIGEGFSVALNTPYTGGHITSFYGKKLREKGKFAVQIEINQALFVDASGTTIQSRKIKTVRDRVLQAMQATAAMGF